MLFETQISCISWFISAIQLNIGRCSYKKSGSLKQQTLFTPQPPERKISEHFRGQIWLSLSPKLPEEPFMSLYQGLGKERPEYRRLLKQCVLAKWLQILYTFDTIFLFVTLFYAVPLIFSTPIRTFIAFQAEDAVEHHLQFSVFSWTGIYSQEQSVKNGNGCGTKTFIFARTHSKTQTCL